MVIGVLEARLLVRESRSLKEKRQVIRSIIDRLKSQFPVTVSEVDFHDDHKRANIGIAALGHEHAAVRNLLHTIQEALRRHPIAEYLGGDLSVGNEVV